jgi:hypothetical protein
MNPDQIELKNINKLFEYEKVSRDIDNIDDINTLKNFAKSYAKLYIKQQEVLIDLQWQSPHPDKN